MMSAVQRGCAVEILALSYTYSNAQYILDNINLSLSPGEIGVIVGPSGSGKTTLLRLISGINKLKTGSIKINGQGSNEARRQNWLSLMPQSPKLLPNRSVRENIRLPLDITQKKDAYDVDMLLELIGMSNSSHLYPAQLSGGMRQRTALARALITRPRLLLMDEPFSALDELFREQLQQEFLQLHSQFSPTTLMITHSVEEAVFVADRIFLFSSLPGRIINDTKIHLDKIHPGMIRLNDDYYRVVKQVREMMRTYL